MLDALNEDNTIELAVTVDNNSPAVIVDTVKDDTFNTLVVIVEPFIDDTVNVLT